MPTAVEHPPEASVKPPAPSATSATAATAASPPTSTLMADIMAAAAPAFAPVAAPEPPKPAAPKAQPKAPVQAPAPKSPPSPSSIPDPIAAPDPAAAVPDDDTPKNLDEPDKLNWRRTREEARAAKAEAEAARKELETVKSKAQSPADWATEKQKLTSELEDYRTRLQVTAIEKDPRFQAYFDGREKFLVEQAKKIGGENGPRLAAILAMPDSEHRTAALDDILSTLPTISQSRIGGILNELENLGAQKQAELAKAADTFKAMQERSVAQQREELAQANSKLEDAIKRWSDPEKGMSVLQEREGDAAWNEQVQATREQARRIFSGQATLEEKIRASLWAASAPRILGELKASKDEIATLMAENEKLRGVQPGHDTAEASPSDPALDDNMPLHLRISRMAANQGAFNNR